MRVVAIVGPSHAGKTTLLKMLTEDFARWGFATSPESLDLDQELGSSHRSDGPRAIELLRLRANKSRGFLLVYIGAGQIVRPDFRDFLQNEPGRVPQVLGIALKWVPRVSLFSRHGHHEPVHSRCSSVTDFRKLST